MLSQLKARLDNLQHQIDELRSLRQGDPALDIASIPSQRKSSVADSEVPCHDARVIDGGPGYPVDGIREQIPCRLHQQMKNLSVPVAVGYALPCPPGTKWHGRDIPAGYAKVGVDEVLKGFHTMELDIPGPEGERRLGDVIGGIILWDKETTKFPDLTPWTTAPPPSPPSPRRSPPPPTTTTTARVHLDLRCRTWVGRLRRRLHPLRRLSGNVSQTFRR